MPYASLLRQRDGPHNRCTAVLRRASRGLRQAAGICVCAHENAPTQALERDVTQHARLRRVRAAPRWLESFHVQWMPTASPRRPSDLKHGRALSCQQRHPTSSQRSRVRTRERATASSRERGDAERVRAAHARCAALAGVGPRPMKAYCASETALSLGPRPCSDVAATASNKQLAFACAHTQTRHRVLSRVR